MENANARGGMAIRLSTKEKIWVGVALAVVTANLVLVGDFVWKMRQVRALLARTDVQLPVAAESREKVDKSDGALITLTLRMDGTVLVDERAMTRDEVFAMLDAKAPEKVKLRASQRLRYDDLRGFLKALAEHQVKDVTFSVVETE